MSNTAETVRPGPGSDKPIPLNTPASSPKKPQREPEATPARQVQGPLAEGQAVKLDVRLIDPNPYQHRENMDEAKLEELMASISAQGLLQPVQVRAAGARYQLIFGHRRKEAHVRLFEATRDERWLQIESIVRPKVSDAEMQLFNLSENLIKEDPPMVDIAAGIAEYIRIQNLSVGQAAEKLGQKEVKVRRLLRLHQAPSVLKTACREGLVIDLEGEGEGKGTKERRRLDFVAALELQRLHKHYQGQDALSAEGKVGAVIGRALKEGWSLRQVERYVAREIGEPGSREQPGKNPIAFKATSTRVTVYRDQLKQASPTEKAQLRQLLEALTRELTP